MTTLRPEMMAHLPDRRGGYRDWAERILARAEHLEEADRQLIEQVYGRGTPLSVVAKMAHQPPRTLQRRLKKIIEHVNIPMFMFIVQHGDLLSGPQRQVARLVVLQRRSLRQAACLADISLHWVRRHMHAIEAMARL